MGLQKNVASQKWRVFAFDTTDGTAKLGDAANITSKIAKDWAAAAATNDVNPTEVEDGYYLFDLTQAESNADALDIYPESSTANIQVVGVPGSQNTKVIQTGDSFARLGAPAGASHAADILIIDNFVDELETRLTAARAGFLDNLNGHTAQTGDSFARLGAPAGASVSADVLVIDNFVDELETRLTAARAANLDEITAVRLATLTDWINGGRLDLLLDAIPTTTMRGTDNAALASVCSEARLAELDAANLPLTTDDTLTDTAVIGALGAGLTDITDRLPAALTKDTADSGTTTTMVDTARTEADDYWNGSWIRFTSGTIAGQTRIITDFDAATDTMTFAPATTLAVGTNTYEIIPAGATGVDWGAVIRAATAVDLSATDIQLVDTCTVNTDVRGTDNASLAADVGLLADAAAVGDPTSADTLMQYMKQLINIIIGTTGVGVMPSGLDPANGVNLFEMLRAAMGSTFATATDSLEQLQADLVSVQSDTDDLQTQIGTAGASLTDLGGMSTGMKAEVNAEVDGALDTTIAELSQAAPTATPTVRTGLMLLYMALRNRLDTNTSGTDELAIYNDAGTKIIKKLLTDAGGDYSEAKTISGA